MDIFSCNFGSNNTFINNLENELKINVRASTDNTGNTPFGDWIMETDNVDLKELYFNNDISKFKGLLFLQNYQRSSIIIPHINEGKNIIYSTQHAFAALKSDVQL